MPDARDEAMRDLVRAREDAVCDAAPGAPAVAGAAAEERDPLRGQDVRGPQAHRRWIAHLKLPEPAQQIAFEEYVQAVEEASERVRRLTQAIEQELPHWRWRPVVVAPGARRGQDR